MNDRIKVCNFINLKEGEETVMIVEAEVVVLVAVAEAVGVHSVEIMEGVVVEPVEVEEDTVNLMEEALLGVVENVKTSGIVKRVVQQSGLEVLIMALIMIGMPPKDIRNRLLSKSPGNDLYNNWI